MTTPIRTHREFLTPEQRAKILSDMVLGRPGKATAHAVGCRLNTVYRWRRRVRKALGETFTAEAR